MVDAVLHAATDADHPAFGDRDVDAAPVAAEQARRLHPPLDVGLLESLREVDIDAVGPALPRPYGVLAPQMSSMRSVIRP